MPSSQPDLRLRRKAAWLFMFGREAVAVGPVPGNSLAAGTCSNENQYPAG